MTSSNLYCIAPLWPREHFSPFTRARARLMFLPRRPIYMPNSSS
jgi:hypothetical protein